MRVDAACTADERDRACRCHAAITRVAAIVVGGGSGFVVSSRAMSEASTPRRIIPEERRASELEVRLEQVGSALQQIRHAAGALHDVETRLSAMTAECTEILNRWAQNDERHAAAVLELHGRLSEWNDIERRLLHESTTRIHQFERSMQHEWQALRDKQEDPVKRLDAEAARVTETCLSAVDRALQGFDRAESRLAAMEEQVQDQMGALAREVRAALAELRDQPPQIGERRPWALDNIVRLHNELRAEPHTGSTERGLAFAGPATEAMLALDRRPDPPPLAPTAAADTAAPADPVPFWLQPSTHAIALVLALVSAIGLYSYAQVQAGLQEVTVRAKAAEQNAADARTEAGREISAVRQQSDWRVASAEEAARGAQALGAILAASDLQRFGMVEGASDRRAALVLWSRAEGVAFSAPRLAAPPPGQTYQLWLLTPSTATSAGIVPVGPDGRANVTFEPPAALPRPIFGVSLTLEPSGGSPQPTGKIYLRSPTPRAVAPAGP